MRGCQRPGHDIVLCTVGCTMAYGSPRCQSFRRTHKAKVVNGATRRGRIGIKED